MFRLQERVKALAFGEVGEHAHGQRAVGVRRGGGGTSRFHPRLRLGWEGLIVKPEKKRQISPGASGHCS